MVKGKAEELNDNYSFFFLLFFLVGAIFALVNSDHLASGLLNEEVSPVQMSAALFFISSIVSSSIMAPYLLPIISFAMGACSIIVIDGIKLAHSLGEDIIVQVLFLATIIPLHFIFCCRGMMIGLCIKISMQSKKDRYKKNLFISYTIMLVAAVVIILFLRAYC